MTVNKTTDESCFYQSKYLLYTLIVVLIIYYAAFVWCSSFVVNGRRFFCLFDDAMISMRYAWNLAHGYGAVWNPGEYIEGYSNPLSVLLMAGAILAFGKLWAPLFVQLLGIGILLGIIRATMIISDDMRPEGESSCMRNRRQFLIVVCTGLYYHLFFFTLVGMETGLVSLLILCGLLFALRYVRCMRSSDLMLTAGAFGLAYIARPDSMIASAVMFILIITEIRKRKDARKYLLQFSSAALLFAAFIAVQHLVRYLYYGELFPNTYILKATGMSFLERLRNGLGYSAPYFIETAPALGLAILHVVRHRSPVLRAMLALPLLQIAYMIYIGGDAWQYWRIAAPGFPVLVVLFVLGARDLCAIFGRNASGKAAIAFALAAVILANGHALINMTLLRFPSSLELNRSTLAKAMAIEQVTTPATRVGLFVAGVIPYYTERPAIDFLGKSDKVIAQLPADTSGSVHFGLINSVSGHNKYDLNYSIKKLQPDVVVEEFRWGRQDIRKWAHEHYLAAKVNGVTLYLRKDSTQVLWDRLPAPPTLISTGGESN